MPWGKFDPQNSSAALMAQGRAIPPFHGRCRCVIVATDAEILEERADRNEDGAPANHVPAEMARRKVAPDGHEIIDKPTYNKLTRDFIKRGGVIIRGEDAKKHLESAGAYASYFVGGDIAFIRDDATISDVLEEMYHAEQERKQLFGKITSSKIYYMREIDAQKYLLKVSKKYKIPIEEQEATKKALKKYEDELKSIEEDEKNV